MSQNLFFNSILASVSVHCSLLNLKYCLVAYEYKTENLIIIETLLSVRGKRVFQLTFFEECRQVPGQPQQVPPACQRLNHNLIQDDADQLLFDPPLWVSLFYSLNKNYYPIYRIAPYV